MLSAKAQMLGIDVSRENEWKRDNRFVYNLCSSVVSESKFNCPLIGLIAVDIRIFKYLSAHNVQFIITLTVPPSVFLLRRWVSVLFVIVLFVLIELFFFPKKKPSNKATESGNEKMFETEFYIEFITVSGLEQSVCYLLRLLIWSH